MAFELTSNFFIPSALLSFPFIINNFVAAEIAEGILPDWRYGYTLFACAVPLCLSLIVGTMFWAQRRAKKINDEKNFHDEVFMAPVEETWMRGLVNTMKEMDVLGLVLITTSLSLVLLPLTLANTAAKGWQNPVMPGMVSPSLRGQVDGLWRPTMIRPTNRSSLVSYCFRSFAGTNAHAPKTPSFRTNSFETGPSSVPV